MISVILIILGLSGLTIFAGERPHIYRDWKTFRSDYGFELKYPDCWIAKGDGPDEAPVASPSSREIFVAETQECSRPRMDKSIPNGIGISVRPVPLKSKDEGQKEITSIEKFVPSHIARNEWKIYKRITPGGGGIEYIYVENETDKFHPYIRWHLELYCPGGKISFFEPMIERPGRTYDEKFKTGDLALPEPEKTIYESIRCVEPKVK